MVARCYQGIDFSINSDFTAVTYLIVVDDKLDTGGVRPKYYFKTHYYLPKDSIEGNGVPNLDIDLVKMWVSNKYVKLLDGNVIDHKLLLEDILRELTHLDKRVFYSYYDPNKAYDWSARCREHDLFNKDSVQPMSQSADFYTSVIADFNKLLKQGDVFIEDSPVTRYCFRNAVLKAVDLYKETFVITKEGQKNKIDGVQSMLMALKASQDAPYIQWWAPRIF